MGNSFDQSQLQRRAAVSIDVVLALDVLEDISDSSSDVDESNGSRAPLNSASSEIDQGCVEVSTFDSIGECMTSPVTTRTPEALWYIFD